MASSLLTKSARTLRSLCGSLLLFGSASALAAGPSGFEAVNPPGAMTSLQCVELTSRMLDANGNALVLPDYIHTKIEGSGGTVYSFNEQDCNDGILSDDRKIIPAGSSEISFWARPGAAGQVTYTGIYTRSSGHNNDASRQYNSYPQDGTKPWQFQISYDADGGGTTPPPPSGNSTNTGLVKQIDTRLGGTEPGSPGVLFFELYSPNTGAPTCSVADGGNEYAIGLGQPIGQSMLTQLLYAQAQNLSVTVAGSGDCEYWADRESPQLIRINF